MTTSVPDPEAEACAKSLLSASDAGSPEALALIELTARRIAGRLAVGILGLYNRDPDAAIRRLAAWIAAAEEDAEPPPRPLRPPLRIVS